eukprot:jgi/Psemu1/56616/gm1.56616_g
MVKLEYAFSPVLWHVRCLVLHLYLLRPAPSVLAIRLVAWCLLGCFGCFVGSPYGVFGRSSHRLIFDRPLPQLPSIALPAAPLIVCSDSPLIGSPAPSTSVLPHLMPADTALTAPSAAPLPRSNHPAFSLDCTDSDPSFRINSALIPVTEFSTFLCFSVAEFSIPSNLICYQSHHPAAAPLNQLASDPFDSPTDCNHN